MAPDTRMLSSIERSLSERLGGRWLVSVHGFFITMLLSFAVLLSHLSIGASDGVAGTTASTRDALLLFGYWVGSVVYAGVVGAAAHFTVFRRRAVQPVSLSKVIAYWVIVMVPATLIYEVGREAAGFSGERPLFWRVIEVATLGILSTGAMVLALDYLTDLRRLRNEYIEKRIQTVLLEQSRQGFFEEVERQLRGELGDSIRAVDPELLSEFKNPSATVLLPNTSRIVETLRRVSSEVVQPASRSLWRVSAETYPSFRVRDFIQTLLVRQLFPTRTLIVLTLLSNLGPTIDEAGLVRGSLLLVAGASTVFMICSGANSVMRNASRHHLSIAAVAFVALQLATYGFNELRSVLGLADISDGVLLLQIGWSAFFVTATMSLGALRLTQIEHLGRFAEAVEEERVVAVAESRKVADAARELSRVLHGAVQTRLAVCGLMIEKARESNDEAMLGLALLEAIAILQAPVEPVTGQETVYSEVARKVALWNGFCDISVGIDPRLIDTPRGATRDIGRIVEEAICNAVRHGGASRISVAVSLNDDDTATVVVEDDGARDFEPPSRGVMSKSRVGANSAGVGSAIFDQIAGGNWTLSRNDSTTRLHVTLPLSGHQSGC